MAWSTYSVLQYLRPVDFSLVYATEILEASFQVTLIVDGRPPA